MVWIVVDGGLYQVALPAARFEVLRRGCCGSSCAKGRGPCEILPPKLKKRQRRGRGRPRKYGKKSPQPGQNAPATGAAGRALPARSTEKRRPSNTKPFWRPTPPAGGVIRVVLVKEDHGWYAFFSTDPNVSAKEIIEAFADRATIEQDFPRREGSVGQRPTASPQHLEQSGSVQLESVDTYAGRNYGRGTKSHEELCDRSDSPWGQRPASALRMPIAAKPCGKNILQNELLTIRHHWRLPRKIIKLAKGLIALGHVT